MSGTSEPNGEAREPEPAFQSQQQHIWSMPKPAVPRRQADEVGRIAMLAGTAICRFSAGVARYGTRAIGHLGRMIELVPSNVRLLFAVGVLMLVGIVGAISAPRTLGLLCSVVVVPVCAITLGALGQRWFSGGASTPMHRPEPVAAVSDLQRSVEYVDKKLTLALGAFGADRQQHAMIALFQAKTAVELTLGTEQDTTGHVDALLAVDIGESRPRIRAGSAPTPLREGSSLAAS